MNKFKLIFLFFLLISIHLHAQTLMRSYYDWTKTRVKEEYYVNSKGEKNGPYKVRDENGIIAETGTYKNGLLDGLCVSYRTTSGQQKLADKVTMKNGERDGPAIYYTGIVNGNEVIFPYPTEQGNYKNDKKEGNWITIELNDVQTFKDQLPLNEEEKKNCSYSKHIGVFKNGEEVFDSLSCHGKISWTYYPSEKPMTVKTLCGVKGPDGQDVVVDALYYYPDGHLSSHKKRDSSGNLISNDFFDRDGKLTSHFDRAMQLAEQAEEEKDKKEEQDKQDRQNAARHAAEQAAEKAEQEENYKILHNGNTPEQEAQSEMNNQLGQEILANWNQYNRAFVELKNTIFTDEQGHRITRETFPHGEYLYKKSNLIILSYMSDFDKAKADKDIVKLQAVSVTIKNACDKMIQLSTSETKELDKQLKKVEDVNEIKRILGI